MELTLYSDIGRSHVSASDPARKKESRVKREGWLCRLGIYWTGPVLETPYPDASDAEVVVVECYSLTTRMVFKFSDWFTKKPIIWTEEDQIMSLSAFCWQ